MSPFSTATGWIHCLTVPTFAPCFGFAPSITSSQSGPYVTPPPPDMGSLCCFRKQQTSVVVWTFPVEWSQRPCDLINGDKRKPTLASALHGNRDTWSLQVFVFTCTCMCVYSLQASCERHFCTLIIFKQSLTCDCSDNTKRALISCYFVRWMKATDTPLCHFLQEKCSRAGIPLPASLSSFFFPLWFCRFLCRVQQPGRSRFTVQSGILINWPVL